jgi:aminopeptidase
MKGTFMKENEAELKKFAQLAVQTGVNLQNGQGLIISAKLDAARFVRMIAAEAYRIGARDVVVDWADDEISLLRFRHASIEMLADTPAWQFSAKNEAVRGDYAILTVYGPNPDLLEAVDGRKVAAYMKAVGKALAAYREYIMNDRIQWSIVAYPSLPWAKKVFPGKPADEAQIALMNEILRISRVAGNADPVAAWETHNRRLHRQADFLNKQRFDRLVYHSPGTDLTIGLPKGHIWAGGSGPSAKGVWFNANIPTEEVFTLPDKRSVNGTVSSTMPLNSDGKVIDHFSLTFRDGKVTDFKAEKGEDTLRHLLDTDEGSRRLGEVALVPCHSPVAESGVIFYNTLFDENASCHLALGKAYPTCIEGGSNMDARRLDRAGVNDSIVHVDFMVGSEDLAIDGIQADGMRVPVFRRGMWALDFD